MSPLVYVSGALAIGCAILGVWIKAQGATISARDATIKERDATIVLKDQQIQQAAVTNAENAGAIKTLRDERAAQSAIAADFDNKSRARDAKLAATLEKLSHGPASEDGPVPVVLERALDLMRQGSAPADPADKNGGGASPAPRRKAALPGGQTVPAGEACSRDNVCLLRGSVYGSP